MIERWRGEFGLDCWGEAEFLFFLLCFTCLPDSPATYVILVHTNDEMKIMQRSSYLLPLFGYFYGLNGNLTSQSISYDLPENGKFTKEPHNNILASLPT